MLLLFSFSVTTQRRLQLGRSTSLNQKVISYRPDIDGLRAVAVLAVVIFHAFPSIIPSGFLGVDIFFVISGYLITSILIRQQKDNSFRYRDFLARRIRRIIPTLTLVLATVCVAGWYLLYKEEFIELGKQILAGSLFYANVLFWSQADYFDTASEAKPLLHLWSLAVEEQFYLIWPPLLLGLMKIHALRKRAPAIVAMFIIGSFIMCVVWTKLDQTTAFYWIHTRAWELLIGAFIAFLPVKLNSVPPLSNHPFRSTHLLLTQFLSLGGATLIAIGFIYSDPESSPGYWAAFPTVGTALMIWVGPRGVINRLLSWKLFVWIGLISYPLYLWHWPIISFLHILEAKVPSTPLMLNGLMLAVLLSVGTYTLLERHTKHAGPSTAYRFLLPLVPVIALIGFLVFNLDGWLERDAAKPQVVKHGGYGQIQFHAKIDSKYPACVDKELLSTAVDFEGVLRCHQSRTDKPPTVALVGDSIAEQLFYGLAEAFPDTSIIYLINAGLPTPNDYRFRGVFSYLERNHSIKHIIYTAKWMTWKGAGFDHSFHNLSGEMNQTLDLFKRLNKKVYVLEQVPHFTIDPNRCRIQRKHWPINNYCISKNHNWEIAARKVHEVIETAASAHGYSLISTHQYFEAGKGQYSMADGDKLLYRDTFHLNLNGSRFLAKRLASSGSLEGVFERN